MARLRFPGRPGQRFDRLGVKYGIDESRSGPDATSRLIDNIHRGLQYFYELFGESDEVKYSNVTRSLHPTWPISISSGESCVSALNTQIIYHIFDIYMYLVMHAYVMLEMTEVL